MDFENISYFSMISIKYTCQIYRGYTTKNDFQHFFLTKCSFSKILSFKMIVVILAKCLDMTIVYD